MTNIKGIAEISGFGKDTGYEAACQDMLQAGFDWLEKNKKSNLDLKTTSPVIKDKKGNDVVSFYGILTPESKDAKALSKAVVSGTDDCTGAMHQAVMGHLMFINKNGLDKWKQEVKDK